MSVGLIIPPSGFLLDERVFPSLGVLKVAAALERTGRDVWVVDLSGREAVTIDPDGLPTEAMLGFTVTTAQLPAAAGLAAALRQARPDLRLILGGPHVTMLRASERLRPGGRAAPAMRALEGLFDVLVAGDGERAALEAIGAHPPRLIDADDPNSPLWLSDQDAAPWPARHLIDLSTYHYEIAGHRATSLIAQLGCPFGCGFCGGRRSPAFRRMRRRSPPSIVQEIQYLYAIYGYTGFMFYDDELNVTPMLPELLRGLIDLQTMLGVTFAFRGFLKAELVTDDQARLLAGAGFRQVLVGVESGDPRILRTINKRATVEDNTRCLDTLRRHGIAVKALVSLGHPGESDETIEATRRWLLSVVPDDFDATIITVYPGTPYYDDAVQTEPDLWTYTAPGGDRLHQIAVDWLSDAAFYKGVPGDYRAYVFTDALSPERLVAGRDTLELEGRAALGLPPLGVAVRQYEHSMGAR